MTYVDVAEPGLPDKILAVHRSLDAAGVRHAFGGALALAYHTLEPRTTADIDVNVSVRASEADRVLAALPNGVERTPDHVASAQQHEQVRLWWGRTPLDLFFRADPFHDGVADRAVERPFAGVLLPFLGADDLATFKALFDRPKDWVDIAAMVEAGAVDLAIVTDNVESIIGPDERCSRLRSLATHGRRGD